MTPSVARPKFGTGTLLALAGSIVIGILFIPVFFQPTQQPIALSVADALNLGLPYLCGTGLSVHRCTLEDVSTACKGDPTKCSAGDKEALKVISGCASSASFLSWNGASWGCSDTQTQQASEADKIYQATATSCASVFTYMTNPFTCMFRTFVSLTAAALIYISTWVLSIAGLLFNWLLDKTVIQFGTFYATIKPAVETAWTAFRDIANILIIGIFTFIAISIILGLKEYGQKKMIAHVLIIAVMINFSLLFAKMIIDASNYTAAQIYTAAALGGTAGTQGGGAGAGTAGTQYGIADQFMYLLGVGTAGSAFKTVNDSAEALDSGWAALGHGILVMMVVLGAAMVLFYGCFLLVSRMIMLIFLMVTASVAFASYLIPKWAGGSYGWSAWWSSLLWCAAFAPVLMLMLWMTLNVSYALKGASNATLGVALSNPTTSSISALFNYILILGLLFGTFKVSSMWAHKIGGFSMAAMVPGLGVAGFGRLAGLLGKNTVGLGSGYLSRRAGKLGAEHDKKENFVRGMLYGGLAKQLEKPYKRDFNLMNTKFGKDITGIAGLKGGWAGETKGKGLEADDKAAAEGYAKRSEKAAESLQKDVAKNKDTMLKEAARSIADLPENKEKAKNIRAQKDAAEKLLEESKKTREENKESLTKASEKHESEKTAAETAIKKSEENMKTVVGRLERDKEYAPESSQEKFKEDIAAARAEHDSTMNREKAKITTASAEVARLQSIDKASKNAIESTEKSLTDIAKQNEAFEAQMKKDSAEAGEKVYTAAMSNVSAEKIAGELVPARLTNIFRKDETNDRLTALTRKHIKESGEEKAIKNLIKKQQDEAGKKPEAEKPTGR